MHEDWDANFVENLLAESLEITQYQKSKGRAPFHQLLCIDDLATRSDVARTGVINTLFTRCRHGFLSVLVKSQVYTLISPSVRKNCDLFVFRLRTNSDLEKVIDELAAIAPGGKKQVLDMYQYATGKPFGFLFCELSKGALAPDEVFHANFTPLILKRDDT